MNNLEAFLTILIPVLEFVKKTKAQRNCV